MTNEANIDCLIVGGGPAGLTAAIYLARFHLNVRVVDANDSRTKWIPCTHNHAGYPLGIAGAALLEDMREQARNFGVVIETARVTRLGVSGDAFEAEWGSGAHFSQSVLLATGVVNRKPSITQELHGEALAGGFLRYCPVCDGYEVTDKNVGVIGTGSAALAEAVFLRSFTESVTLVAPDGSHNFDAEDQAKIAQFTIALVDGPAHILQIDEKHLIVGCAAGELGFDSVYPALGSDVNSDLAVALGATTSEDGAIIVDSHQRTTVTGLYAAGDVVLGLDQISHAMGEGGVAATTIRNDLAALRPMMRERNLI